MSRRQCKPRSWAHCVRDARSSCCRREVDVLDKGVQLRPSALHCPGTHCEDGECWGGCSTPASLKVAHNAGCDLTLALSSCHLSCSHQPRPPTSQESPCPTWAPRAPSSEGSVRRGWHGFRGPFTAPEYRLSRAAGLLGCLKPI